MKPPPFDCRAPQTLAEAVTLVAEFGEDGKLLVGGQSLIPVLALRLASPRVLITGSQNIVAAVHNAASRMRNPVS